MTFRPRWLTPEQVRQRLDVHIDTVMRMIHAGELAATKIRHRWRIRPEDLDRYLEENTTGTRGTFH